MVFVIFEILGGFPCKFKHICSIPKEYASLDFARKAYPELNDPTKRFQIRQITRIPTSNYWVKYHNKILMTGSFDEFEAWMMKRMAKRRKRMSAKAKARWLAKWGSQYKKVEDVTQAKDKK